MVCSYRIITGIWHYTRLSKGVCSTIDRNLNPSVSANVHLINISFNDVIIPKLSALALACFALIIISTEVRLSTFFWSSPQENFNNLNKHVVLDFIRYSPNGISRVELSRQLTLSRGGVTAIISEFITMGLGHEMVVSHPSGTKPILLEISSAPGFAAGGNAVARNAIEAVKKGRRGALSQISRVSPSGRGMSLPRLAAETCSRSRFYLRRARTLAQHWQVW